MMIVDLLSCSQTKKTKKKKYILVKPLMFSVLGLKFKTYIIQESIH